MKRIKTYWLLLLVLIYTATAVLSVGDTQARYVNTACWDTVLGEAEAMVTSDLLQSVEEPEVTVLLGEMLQETYQIPITLESGADVEGELTWEVEQPDYLTVEMSVDAVALAADEPEALSEEQGKLIRLEAGKPQTVVMNLIPEEGVFEAPRSAETVLVIVRWGNVLQGKFLVEFPEVEEAVEETLPETTNPEVTDPETTDPEVTDPEVTDPEVTDPEVTDPETTDPEVTDPEVTDPEITAPEVTAPEVTDPEVTDPEVTDPEVTDPEVTDPEVTDPEVTDTETTAPAETASETTAPAETETEATAAAETEATDPVYDGSEETDPVAPASEDVEPDGDASADEADQDLVISEDSGTESTEETNEENGDSQEPTDSVSDEDVPVLPETTIEENGSDAQQQTDAADGTSGTDDTGTEDSGEEDTGAEDSGTDEPATEGSGTDASGEGDGSTVEGEDVPAPSDPVEIEVVADECVDADSRLTVQIVSPDDVEKLQLGLGIEIAAADDTEGTTETVIGNFPQFMRYSDDGGESYYMLYHAGLVEVEASAEGALPLLLDFSRTGIEAEELVIAVAGLNGELLVGSGSAVVSVKPQENATLSSCFLSDEQPLRVDIPESWNEYTAEVIIEALTCTWNEDGTAYEMEYSAVEPEEIGINLETETDTGALILSIGDVLPPAGTYRISINWTYEDECIAEMQENFFINYLAYHKVVETGGAEQ